jgi:hypothetical protein
LVGAAAGRRGIGQREDEDANVLVVRHLLLLALLAAGLASALPLVARTPEIPAVKLDAQLQRLVESRT